MDEVKGHDSVPRLYVIFHDEYMGTGYDCYEFEGTFKQLLQHLNHMDEGTMEEMLPYKPIPNFTIEEDDPNYFKLGKYFTTEELKSLFDNANGDGQPYYVVYDTTIRQKVIG